MTVVFGVDGGPALPASGKSMDPGTFISLVTQQILLFVLFANPAVPEFLGARVGDEVASP